MDVLLVDDEEELISTLSQRLTFRKINADWTTIGEDALQRVKNTDYDIAILDIKMPGINGIDLGEKIRKIRPDIKIIFITGHGSASYFNTGYTQSDNEYYLTKPININKLIEKMYQLITNKK